MRFDVVIVGAGIGGAVPSLVARTINALGWPKRKILDSFATTFVHPQKQAA
jgi:hypothetical protein